MKNLEGYFLLIGNILILNILSISILGYHFEFYFNY